MKKKLSRLTMVSLILMTMNNELLAAKLLTDKVNNLAVSDDKIYDLVMSKDETVCHTGAKFFLENPEDSRYFDINKFEEFRVVNWEVAGEYPVIMSTVVFDINNDGVNELVYKASFALGGIISDDLKVFANVKEKKLLISEDRRDSYEIFLEFYKGKLLKLNLEYSFLALEPLFEFNHTGHGYDLTEIPKTPSFYGDGERFEVLMGQFAVHPFLLNGVYYLSISDKRQGFGLTTIEYVQFQVISKLNEKNELIDICYFKKIDKEIE